jgi:hypothetical protein
MKEKLRRKNIKTTIGLGTVAIFTIITGYSLFNCGIDEIPKGIAANEKSSGNASQSVAGPNGSYSMKTTATALNNPGVTGTIIYIPWQKIKPCKAGTSGTDPNNKPCQEGDYNWAEIDKELNLAEAVGKPVTLDIQAGGKQVPDWLRNTAGIQLIDFLDTNSYRASNCTRFSMPVYWDPIFLGKKKEFISDLGKKYGSNSNIKGMMVQFVQTFANDWYLPRLLSTQNACPEDEDENQIQKWIDVGYSTDKMYNAGKETIDAWANAFPGKALKHPIHRTDKRLDSTPAELAEKIINYGYSKYPDRFYAQLNTLKTDTLCASDAKITGAKPENNSQDYYIMRMLSQHPNQIGLQMLAAATNGPSVDNCRQNGGAEPCDPETVLQKSVDVALSYKPAYIEYWHEDAENPDLQDVLKYANSKMAEDIVLKDDEASSVLDGIVQPANSCLKTKITAGKSRYSLILTNPSDNKGSICIDNKKAAVKSFPNWPDMTQYGWSMSHGVNVQNGDGFNWCSIGYSKNTHPTSMDVDETYGRRNKRGIVIGGDSTGKFCFVFSKASTSPKKWIWCTETGCKKEGF